MQSILLESFDLDDDEPTGGDAAYQEGYAEGYTAGQTAAANAQQALEGALVQAIADIEFKYEEARGEITRSLAPLFQVLVERILPHCIANGFADQIVTSLTAVMGTAETGQATVFVHPSQRLSVEAALERFSIIASVSDDPMLGQHAAWVRHCDKEIHIDQDKVLADISAVLAAVHLSQTRTQSHG